jgi:hypothetical protein
MPMLIPVFGRANQIITPIFLELESHIQKQAF